MIETTISADGQAMLLLCSTLGLPRGTKPLGLAEWNQVASAMAAAGQARPGSLLGESAARLASELGVRADMADRMASLLARGGQLALELDRLSSRGIWTMTRADVEYPARLKTRLKQQAPPVLFGAGAASALTASGLAIVGSRDVDEAGLTFAKRLARSCAEAGLVVVSGGARGTDSAAQDEALDAGGRALVVLADSLERAIQNRAVLAAVRAGRLTLLTPLHPSTPFSVGAAMGRNRLIYGLSDGAVVVSSAAGEGGTWAGAIENLERRWVALYVRSGSNVPQGNQALLDKGARPLAAEQIASGADVATMRDAVAFPDHNGALMVRDGLFSPTHSESASQGEASTTDPASNAPTPQAVSVEIQAADPHKPRAGSRLGADTDVYLLVIERIQAFCGEPRTADEIAAAFAIEPAQARVWLARAVSEGALQKRAKPVRYLAAGGTLFAS